MWLVTDLLVFLVKHVGANLPEKHDCYSTNLVLRFEGWLKLAAENETAKSVCHATGKRKDSTAAGSRGQDLLECPLQSIKKKILYWESGLILWIINRTLVWTES